MGLPSLDDISKIIGIVGGGASLLGSLFGGDEEQGGQFPPTGGAFRRQTMLGPATGQEMELAGLQQSLAQQAFRTAGEPLPGTLSLQNLAAGRLPSESMQRIRQQAFGGLDVGLQQASRLAQERALARGVPLSSIQGIQEAELQRPLLAQAGQMFAGLQQQELGRLGGLRQQALANQLAVQQSPALQRLLQIRLAQGEERGIELGPEQLSQMPELTEELLGDLIPGFFERKRREAEEAKRKEKGGGGFLGGLLGTVGGILGTAFGGPLGGIAGSQAGKFFGSAID